MGQNHWTVARAPVVRDVQVNTWPKFPSFSGKRTECKIFFAQIYSGQTESEAFFVAPRMQDCTFVAVYCVGGGGGGGQRWGRGFLGGSWREWLRYEQPPWNAWYATPRESDFMCFIWEAAQMIWPMLPPHGNFNRYLFVRGSWQHMAWNHVVSLLTCPIKSLLNDNWHIIYLSKEDVGILRGKLRKNDPACFSPQV